jgi:hypothetical protein
MKLPRLRFTIRRLMLAVAIVGVLMGSLVEWNVLRHRASLYRKRAQDHADMETSLRFTAEGPGGTNRVDISPGPGIPSKPFPIQVVIDHEVRLRRKWEKAARYPWLTVEPDPPEPK